MEKWWKVKRGVPLTDAQKAKAVDFLMAWVSRHISEDCIWEINLLNVILEDGFVRRGFSVRWLEN